MGHRLSKITTKTGDDGTSSLASGERISKTHIVFHLLGDLDELNAHLGIVKTQLKSSQKAYIEKVQHHLMDVSGQIALPEHALLTDDAIHTIETLAETLNDSLPPLKEFVIPGNSLASAQVHLARAVCRRAERCAVAYSVEASLDTTNQKRIIRYLNRLSDLLFIFARFLDHQDNIPEPLWQSGLNKQSD